MKQHVAGYNVRSSYDGPYLKGADFDPDEVFANAGDPEAAQAVQEAKQAKPEPVEVVETEPTEAPKIKFVETSKED
jgi:hypothetical protein